MKTSLIVLLITTNLAWAVECRRLWYQAAEAEGHLDEALHYIQTHLPDNTVDCDPQMVNGKEQEHCAVDDAKPAVKP